jgi:hypothetical protein
MSTFKMSEQNRQRRAETCVHFTGIQNKACKAHHAYAQFGRALPCLRPTGDPSAERPPCVDRRYPTEEEIDARERRMGEGLERMGKARRAITSHIEETGRKGRSYGDTIPCPCCEGGTLHYSYAGSYNGHIHAQCTTPGCNAWME